MKHNTDRILVSHAGNLPRPDDVTTQAEFLRRHGLDELVEEGRRLWQAGAAAPDLTALTGRSRLQEADALTEPDGLGGFTVAQWLVGPA